MPVCPNCHDYCIERVYGPWCPRCRGWYVSYIKPSGAPMAYIQCYRYLA